MPNAEAIGPAARDAVDHGIPVVGLNAGMTAYQDYGLTGFFGQDETVAGRAENALATLRASGQETDLLHDRIIKAREVKAQLETLIARAPAMAPARIVEEEPARRATPAALAPAPAASEDEERAERMAALAQRIQGLASPASNRRNEAVAPAGRDNVAAIVQALTAGRSANHSAKQSLNAARRNLDDDLFAA